MKLSITELSNLTGMDRRKIRRLLQDLPSEKGNKGAVLYESSDALSLLYASDAANRAGDLNAERARLTHHQANIAELDEREKRKSLIDRDEAIAEVTHAHANMSTKLLSISPKTATLLVSLDDVGEIESILDEAVRECLQELHNYANNSLHAGPIQTTTETESE